MLEANGNRLVVHAYKQALIVPSSLAAHLGCAPVKVSRSEWFKCLLCRVKMFLKAHRI